MVRTGSGRVWEILILIVGNLGVVLDRGLWWVREATKWRELARERADRISGEACSGRSRRLCQMRTESINQLRGVYVSNANLSPI